MDSAEVIEARIEDGGAHSASDVRGEVKIECTGKTSALEDGEDSVTEGNRDF
jgi:hypothetical protein